MEISLCLVENECKLAMKFVNVLITVTRWSTRNHDLLNLKEIVR